VKETTVLLVNACPLAQQLPWLLFLPKQEGKRIRMCETKNPIRVVVADDHPVVREGLRMMLEEMAEGFTLVGDAADGATALRLVEQVQPDVVLMDLRMPGMDGVAAIHAIRTRWPHIAVLVLTTYNEDALIIRSLQAGACGYLLKETDVETLLQAIRTAARGEMLIQPEVMTRLLARAAASTLRHDGDGQQELTVRECEVLTGVAQGERSKEIARRLGITERTVRAHLTSIYTKLDVDGRAAAVKVAIERGILQ
jgi:NarL family two-component system response regulator YdfI